MIFSALRRKKARQKCLEGEGPAYLQTYFEKEGTKPAPSTPISEVRFVVFDTETTGFSVKRDKVISVGAVVVHQHMIHMDQSLEAIVQTQSKNKSTAIPVHGIISEEITQGCVSYEANKEFVDLIGADVMVAHHANFDVSMMEKMISEEMRGFRFYNPVLDTVMLAKKLLYPTTSLEHLSPSKLSLDTLIDQFGITASDRHTAWGDALITAKLLLIILKQFEQKGITKLKDLR